ncbi:MAG: hypothetical protein AB8C84_08860 [Oligoflexales bacterium]
MFDQDLIKLSPRYCKSQWVCPPQRKDQQLIVFICPHGGEGKLFLEHYQEIFAAFPGDRKSFFQNYLDIEQDKGAWEWTTEICNQMKLENQDIAILKVLFDFPRGVLDGGRKVEYCIGEMLPKFLLDKYSIEWRKIQSDLIQYLECVYQEVRRTQGLLLDLHTMAPHCRIDEEPRIYDLLERYLDSYSVMDGARRSWDLIVGEKDGVILADKKMMTMMCESLVESDVSYKINDPYPAAPAYLMHLHMSKCPTIAIDIPKTELCDSSRSWSLNDFDVDPNRVKFCAAIVVKALKKWMGCV